MRKFISKFDLFPASPVLRANGQIEVVNFCGGLFSICIFGFFTYIFISNIISMAKLENITATQIVETKSGSNNRIGNITMGIGMQQLNLVSLQHIFEVRAFIVNQFYQESQISVFPCTRQMWSDLDDTRYSALNLDTHMCVQRDNVSVFGENGSPLINVLYFNLSKCSNDSSPVPCASATDIHNYFTMNLSFGRFFACTMVILDTGLNPTKEDPYAYSVYQKTMWLLFNQHQQILGQVYLGSYQVTTDTNFLPITNQTTQTGYFVSEVTITTLVNVFNLSVFVEFYVFATPLNRKIHRTYGKIDSILSYVGGLYGIVLSFFTFFVASYNQYKYQLRVSQGAFSFDDGHLARETDLHFGKYLKYVLFDWIKTLTCFEIDWEDCKAINQARIEAIQQIDVKHLLKRISHLQKIMSILIKDQQQTAIFMTQPNSISQVKRRRDITQYCQKFTHANQSLTMTHVDQINAIISLGLGASSESFANKVVPGENVDTSLYQFQRTQGLKNQDERDERVEKSSLEMMDSYLEKYQGKQHLTPQFLNLNYQNLRTEQELAQAFYSLSQQTRMKLIKKIPLGILYRLTLHSPIKQQQQKTVSIIEQFQYKPMKRRKKKTNLQPLDFPTQNIK